MSEETRRLDWPDCDNVRDLGWLPTTDGTRIRRGALVRADSLHRLTSAGVAALWRHGVSRVIDLRSATEAAAAPGPLAGDPRYRLLPLIDPAAEARRNPTEEPTLTSVYQASIVRNAKYIVAGIAAIADAPPGAVVVHCVAGKDRTGMTIALALRACDATDDAIAADYAYTATCLAERLRVELDAAVDEVTRQRLNTQQSCAPETILSMLRTLDDRYGSVAGYLLTHGLTQPQLNQLRHRLRAPSSPADKPDGRPPSRSAGMVGRDVVGVGSVRQTVTSREEVRPMNAVPMWVLPSSSRSGD